jgi:hypothetical protein
VSAPQPGDLIVWRGHVGLVVDSRQHLFYSSLRSGLETEDYTSAYWRRRGAPRFYRYRATSDQTILTARELPRRNDIEGNFRTQLVSQSVNDQLRTNVTSRTSIEPLSSSNEDSPTQDPSKGEEINQTTPSRVIIDGGNKKPTPQQLTEAISKSYQFSPQGLNAESLLHSKATVVIFTRLRVEHLEFKGKHGWADVGIDTEATLRSGTLEKAAHYDEQRWELQHAKSGWTVIVPTQNMYVPRALAVRMFAQQLAQLTDLSNSEVAVSSASEESHLASLLNALLNK